MIPIYFGTHPAVFRSGIAAKMPASAFKLYSALLHESERYSTRLLRTTDARLMELTGLSQRTITKMRGHLFGLVEVRERHDSRGYEYLILDVETGKPYPGSPRDKVHYMPGLKAKPPAAQPQPPEPDSYGVPVSFNDS